MLLRALLIVWVTKLVVEGLLPRVLLPLRLFDLVALFYGPYIFCGFFYSRNTCMAWWIMRSSALGRILWLGVGCIEVMICGGATPSWYLSRLPIDV